jgi:hypothetical protein
MFSNKKWLAGLSVVALVIASPASASVLAEYTFEASPSGTLSPTSTRAGISADPVTFGNADVDLNAVLGGGFGVTQRTSTTTQLLANAIAADDYLSLTIGPVVAGDAYSVSSVSYRYFLSDTNTFGDYQTTLFSSATNATPGTFAAGDEIGAGVIVGTSTSTPTSNTVTIDTSGIAALQNRLDDVEFRIYFTDDQNVSGHVHAIDDIVINGVPEPGSLALVSFAGLGLLRRRSRN